MKSAELLGMKQPDVSAIATGRTGTFSMDRLVRCLESLIELEKGDAADK
ncbi:XRE family transcriptional regulator [Mesorhizobium sp. LSHC414A00]|nr:XRE family transcriptional regulator [Mesorhizobium sp. LSHC414A00]ESX71842.1 hypothetical protein X757_22330 [Mesorhizobium sp. LSHC414A00]